MEEGYSLYVTGHRYVNWDNASACLPFLCVYMFLPFINTYLYIYILFDEFFPNFDNYHYDSLGGALATMFSFKLAGAGTTSDWVPRPLTCITYAAPFTGTGGYRAAFEVRRTDRQNKYRAII